MKHASMNRIYRLVWNTALGLWVAVAENAKGASKGGSARRAVLALASVLSLLSPLAHAADAANAAVTVGTGSVSTAGAVTTINQFSNRMAVDWTKLSTTANEALVFKQPGASSIALNRVTGSDPTQLLGSLSANGQVFILNPNGVMFGAGSQVNVGGLVASTLSLSNEDFMAGKLSFANNGASGTILNQGTLTAGEGGYLALLGPQVRNEGVMTARLGTALMAAGNKVTLNLNNGSLVGYSIDQGAVNALADNGGLIKADGGQVLLTATALDALATATVNNTGVIEAQTVENKSGRIILLGDKQYGTTMVGGTLDASAPNGGDGGFVETSAAYVRINEQSKVTTSAPSGRTGKYLIDPATWDIFQGPLAGGNGSIGGNNFSSNAWVNDQLSRNDLLINTDTGTGVINVHAALNWAANTTLTLQSGGSLGTITLSAPISFAMGGLTLNSSSQINVSAAIDGKLLNLVKGTWVQNGNGAALPALNVADFRINNGNTTFVRALSGDGSTNTPYQLADIYGVQGMGSAGMLGKSYLLANDIDASGTQGWNGGAGFKPISVEYNRVSVGPSFTGTLDGANHTINGLFISRSTDYVGLFAATYGASIHNIGLTNVSVTGQSFTGGLVGLASYSDIVSASVTGTVSSGAFTDVPQSTGGLIGRAQVASIARSSFSGTVSGIYQVGGLIGFAERPVYETLYTTVTDSHADAAVSGIGAWTGGLVGLSIRSTAISGSYATGSVRGDFKVGGLAGSNEDGSTINNSYSTAAVKGGSGVGGLVGVNDYSTISNSYAAGAVTPASVSSSGLGGLVGQGDPTQVSASFWNMETSGQVLSAGGSGFSSAQMTSRQPFVDAGWSVSAVGGSQAIWRIYEGHTAPLLRSFIAPITLADQSLVYNGTAQALAASADPQLISSVAPSKNVGTYDGYYSTQQGYDISGGALIITKADLTVTAQGAPKTYDATTNAAVTLSGGFAGDDLALAGTANFVSKNAGQNIAINVTGIIAGGVDAGNYNAPNPTATTSATISKADLTVTAQGAPKTYDGTAHAEVALSGGFVGDDLSFGGTANFVSKNAGQNVGINVTGISASGADIGNYNAPNATASTSATIERANLTVSAQGIDKVYDGTLNATVSHDSTKLAGDELSISSKALFVSKNAAQNVSIQVSDITLAGIDAGNYNLLNTTATTSARIAPAQVTVVIDGNGNVNIKGLVAGDMLTDLTAGNYGFSNANLLLASGTGGLLASLPVLASLHTPPMPSILSLYGCGTQAVTGLGGSQSNSGAGCSTGANPDVMETRLGNRGVEDGR